MFIDTHCHLNFSAFDKDIPDVLKRAEAVGVKKIIVPGTDLISSQKALNIAQTYPEICFAAVGIHPHHAQSPDLPEINILRQELKKLIMDSGPASVPKKGGLRRGKIVAIGEIGLDFYQYQKTKYANNRITDNIKRKQFELLKMQLDLSLEYDLPLILHCREAFPELIQFLQNNSRIASPVNNYIKPTQPGKTLRGVCHCFTGSIQELQLLITMGYYIGFDGNITYQDKFPPLVASTPLNRIILETDSPFLTPIPYRKQRNEPKNIPLIVQAVSRYHHASLSEVIHLSTINAQQLFGL